MSDRRGQPGSSRLRARAISEASAGGDGAATAIEPLRHPHVFVLLGVIALLAIAGIGALASSDAGWASSCGSSSCPTGTGSISGTVTQADTGARPGTWVKVDDGNGHVWNAFTDASGDFEVTQLPPGSYVVRFQPIGHVVEWYDDSTTANDATPVVLGSGDVRTGVDAVVNPVGPVVSGVLTDAGTGQPVAGVCVTPYLDGAFPQPAFSAGGWSCPLTTGPSGQYELGGLSQGSYRIQASDALGGYITEWYGGSPAYAGATPVPLGAGDSSGADIALDLGGRITGTITDGTNGAPLTGRLVLVYPAGAPPTSSTPVLATHYSAAGGSFTTNPLPPGDYVVHAGPSPFGFADPTYVGEWYGDVLDFASAITVTVTAGATQSGVDFALAHGAHISGKVVDESTGGALISATGAVIVLDASTGTMVTGGIASSIDGSFVSFGALPPGQYVIGGSTFTCCALSFAPDIVSGGYRSEYYDDAYTREDATVIAITGSSDVTGIVVDLVREQPMMFGVVVNELTGDPLSNVGIALYDTVGDLVYFGSTRTDGSFAIALVDSVGTHEPLEGDYVLWAYSAPGYVTEYYDDTSSFSEATRLTLDGNAGAPDVTGIVVDLQPLKSISGVLVDDETGAPVANETVSAYDAVTGTMYRGGTLSGSDGTFSLQLNADSYVIRAEGGTHRPEFYADASSFDDATPIVLTNGGPDVTGLVMELAARSRIHGVVADAVTGLPIESAMVAVASPADPTYMLTTGFTAADGSFSVPVDNGSYLLQVSDPDSRYATEWYQNQPSHATAAVLTVVGSDVSADVALDAGGTISGVLRDDATGDPIPFVSVGFYKSGEGLVDTATSDEHGHYRSKAFIQGDLLVRALPLGHATYASEWFDDAAHMADATPVAVTTGADHSGVDFGLALATSIRGVVTDAATTTPIVGANVSAVATTDGFFVFSATTADDGSYSISAPPGTYLVLAQPEGYDAEYFDGAQTGSDATPVVTSSGSLTGIDFQLGGAALDGVITDSATGAPIANVCVYVRETQTDGAEAYDCTDDAGFYEVHVPAGAYVVSVYFTGSTPYLRTSRDNGGAGFEVEAGAIRSVDLQLERGARVSGTITDDATGAPLPHVCVSVIGPVSGSACSGYDGHYVTDAVPSGNYLIQFTNTGGRYVSELYDDVFEWEDATEVELSAGVDLTGIDAALSLGATLSGLVTNEVTGDPVTGACVEVLDLANDDLIATSCTDAGGSYLVTGIRPGDWVVRFFAPGMHTEYFDNVTDLGDATPITFASGDELTSDAALASIMRAPSVSAVGFADGDAVVFGRSPAGELWYRESSGGDFGDWTQLADSDVASGPAAAHIGSDVIVFFRSSSGAVHYFERTGGSWGDEQDLGGLVVGAPSVVVDGNGGLIVAALNSDGITFVNRLSGGGTWSGWSPLDGILVGRLELQSDGTDVDLFGRNGARSYWTRHFSTATETWGPWVSLDGVLRSSPTAAGVGDGMHVFGVNPDGILFTRVRAAGGDTWSDWESLDGVLSSDPNAAATDDTLFVFGVNPGAALFDRRLSGVVWGGWDPLDGVLMSGPESVAAGDYAYVFALNPDGNLWYRLWDGSSFGSWTNLSGILAVE